VTKRTLDGLSTRALCQMFAGMIAAVPGISGADHLLLQLPRRSSISPSMRKASSSPEGCRSHQLQSREYSKTLRMRPS
jgi:hypothetical protein